MAWTNEKAATEAGEMVARRLFASRGNHSEIHLKEDEVALIAKLSYELGVQAGIKAAEAAQCPFLEDVEHNWRDYDDEDLEHRMSLDEQVARERGANTSYDDKE